MKFDPPLAQGVLVRRYKRFLADVITQQGQALTLHCPNTGAMTGADEPGSEVWYSESANLKRKYPHTLEVVCSARGKIGVNTLRANRLIHEALQARQIDSLAGYSQIKTEAAIPEGNGRFDFRLTAPALPICYVEVKNMTLALAHGRGAFPDAVSERALKHVEALKAAIGRGERAVLLFCVTHSGIDFATPADEIHPAYGQALREASAAGVEILALKFSLTRFEFKPDRLVPVDLTLS
ncbi:MAG: DNA/RNA nuclease SfsA [Proteobacteria bacterium]|nr:DNA/RNA nuclease SfsA [Pseudomonadota bacterium]